jgi:hypothetical protein
MAQITSVIALPIGSHLPHDTEGNVHMQQLTPVHTWNNCTDVPCSGEGETRCELYPCVNAMYPHKTEVRRVMWLQDADDAAELRMATAKESSGQWCGWRLRFELSTVTKTFVVKDAERSLGGGGGRGMSTGERSTVLAAAFIRMRNWCRTAQGCACTCALPGRCGWTVRFW